MTKLTPIALLFLAANLLAQEADAPASEAPNEAAEEQAANQQEAPALDQVVPVAEQPIADDAVMTAEMPAEMSEEEELIFQYERYISLMRDGVYDEADSVAKRVVELAIKVKGPKSSDFSKALTNLAIVQHRTDQYDAAQQNFESAIEIIEDNEDQLNAQLINPLRGLGLSQLESGRPDKAAATFRRAVHVSHVNEGPHNLDQLSILESLSETHLRMGSVEDAKHMQDVMYAINERAYANNALEMVPALLRRAEWQHRAGFINDQRASLRRAIRIIEKTLGKDDMSLVEPLTQLGQSFFYIDLSGSPYGTTTLATGETHFKRALRIAREDPDTNWEMIAETTLSLGDYYNFLDNMQQANKIYLAAWRDLEGSEDRKTYRRENLEQAVVLRENRLPDVVTPPTEESNRGQQVPLSQGSITLSYDISDRGRPVNLKIIEAEPREFVDLHRKVQREMRRRIYRPRYTETGPTKTEQQVIVHKYFYKQAELDALRQPQPAETEET
ncbi:MAG: tetratricopeptide repeat protein [Woeseiaceae bacterium]